MKHIYFRTVALIISSISFGATTGSVTARAAAVPPSETASSAAYGLSANLMSEGTATGFGPVGAVHGSAPPAYNLHTTVPAFSETIGIAAGSRQIGTLEVTSGGINAAASSAGLGVDSVSVQGSASVGSVQLVLQLYPPPPIPQPQPMLSLSASTVSVMADDQQVVPQPANVAATTSIGKLVVTGTLLGGQTLTYSGSPPKGGLVLFSSPNLTITLNQQVVAGIIGCGPSCVFAPTAITADAVAIHLNQVAFLDDTVTGDITVGEANAAIP
jgi:hypothetical protein